MFDYLPAACRELRAVTLDCYWLLIIPFCAFILVMEFFNLPDGNPNAGDIIRRVVISLILLLSFDEVIKILAMLGDGISAKIGGIVGLRELVKILGVKYQESSISWASFKDAVIFVLSLCAYIFAYLGIYVADLLVHFVWSILYVCSPLMILMFISKRTSFITINLYKGLLNVISWKILWSILGVMLLKLAQVHQVGDWNNFLTSVLMNLCIGSCMLFIPFATKSLISDGLSSAASGLAAIPTIAAGGMLKEFAASKAKLASVKVQSHTGQGLKRISSSLSNAPQRYKEAQKMRALQNMIKRRTNTQTRFKR